MKTPMFSLPNPCSEDWNKMKPTELGRHCMKCDKVVVDCTEMSDKEMAQLVNHQNGKPICVRIKQKKKVAVLKRWTINAAVLASLFPIYSFEISTDKLTTETSNHFMQEQYFVIQGVIRDKETQEPVPFAKVMVQGANQLFGSVSDFDGNYKLQLPVSAFNNQEQLTLKIQHIEFKDIELLVSPKENYSITYVNVQLNQEEYDIRIGMIIPAPQPLIHGENPFETKIEQPFRRNRNKR